MITMRNGISVTEEDLVFTMVNLEWRFVKIQVVTDFCYPD